MRAFFPAGCLCDCPALDRSGVRARTDGGVVKKTFGGALAGVSDPRAGNSSIDWQGGWRFPGARPLLSLIRPFGRSCCAVFRRSDPWRAQSRWIWREAAKSGTSGNCGLGVPVKLQLITRPRPTPLEAFRLLGSAEAGEGNGTKPSRDLLSPRRAASLAGPSATRWIHPLFGVACYSWRIKSVRWSPQNWCRQLSCSAAAHGYACLAAARPWP